MLASFDVVIFDGITQHHYEPFVEIAREWAQTRSLSRSYAAAVFTSSEPIPVSIERLRKAGLSEFCLEPWTLPEFQSACSDDSFFQSVESRLRVSDLQLPSADRQQMVVDKFFYAGYSARWMFEYSFAQVKRNVFVHLSMCSDFSILLRHYVEEKFALAMHRLTVPFGRSSIIISQYVWRLLTQSCIDYSRLRDAVSISADGSVHDGWAEADFSFQLQKAARSDLRLRVHDSEGQDEVWSVPRLIHADPMSSPPLADSWLIPLAPNQGCFDMLQLFTTDGRRTLRFVNVTRAALHSVNASYMQALLEHWQHQKNIIVQAIEFVFVHPSNTAAPTWPNIIAGNLSAWGWNPQVHIRSVSFDRLQ